MTNLSRCVHNWRWWLFTAFRALRLLPAALFGLFIAVMAVPFLIVFPHLVHDLSIREIGRWFWPEWTR